MKALFVTTPTADCLNHVRAWRSFACADHYVMQSRGIRIDWRVVQAIRDSAADVVFYISANQGVYALKWRTLVEIRQMLKERHTKQNPMAPFVNLCSDAADSPWHGVLAAYAKHRCFDLQVSLDGGSCIDVDLKMLTPIDPTPYEREEVKDIRCGFSGSMGLYSQRSEMLRALEWLGGLTIRDRSEESYGEHVDFIKRCRMMINTSWTGSGMAHHVKGRVLEAGWAKATLLESAGSPLGDWFPSDCYLLWNNVKEAAEMIRDLDDATIDHAAKRLAEEVRYRYTPRIIYGQILERVGLRIDDFVDLTVSRTAA